MNSSLIFSLASHSLLLYSLLLLIPGMVSLVPLWGTPTQLGNEQWAFILPVSLTFILSGIFRLKVNKKEKIRSAAPTLRTVFLIVTLCWIIAAAIGSLPYLIELDISLSDAYFEAMSGFTTTGATVIADVEAMSPGLNLWRCLTQWVGGMGIIILFVSVLPILGAGGYNFFRAEIPGGTNVEKIKPRVAETAKTLWKLYIFLTFWAILFLKLAGLSLMDAVCHALATMPTGGFSNKNMGVSAFESPLVEVILIVFMVIVGVNFSLHFHFRHGKNVYLKNSEFCTYIYILVSASFVLASILLLTGVPDYSPFEAVISAVFQVLYIVTTTGYSSEDFNQWAPACKLILFTLMFVGGCVGSTGGSVKVLRWRVIVKALLRELYQTVNPRTVVVIRSGEDAVPDKAVLSIFCFMLFFMLSFLLGSFVFALTGLDLVSALSAGASAIGNVGPGLGSVGPASTFAHLHPFAKWVFIFLMLIGRLELYTVLLIFYGRR
ncbi:MAG: TrkH family potassium uptake protein [Nitrospinota bacterium]